MPTSSDTEHNIGNGPIAKGRDPKARKNKSIGEQAMMDAIILVVVAWLIVFMLAGSLRHHNV